LLGQQQSGLPDLRFSDLATNLNLIRQARELVAKSFAEHLPGGAGLRPVVSGVTLGNRLRM